MTLPNSIYVEDLNSFKFEVRIKTIFVSNLEGERERETDRHTEGHSHIKTFIDF